MTTTYTTAAQAAAKIRAELKTRYGYTSRDVSVRCENFSLGSAVRVVIKRPGILLSRVEEVARKEERIERDAWGEILGGGNRHIKVSLDWGLVDACTSRIVEALAVGGSVALGPFTVHEEGHFGHRALQIHEDAAVSLLPGVVAPGESAAWISARALIQLGAVCSCGAIPGASGKLAEHAEGCPQRPPA